MKLDKSDGKRDIYAPTESAVLTHVHEFEGSTMLAELEEEPHNHRFAGVTGPVIVVPGGHVHSVFTRTDFFDDHYHFLDTVTGLPNLLFSPLWNKETLH